MVKFLARSINYIAGNWVRKGHVMISGSMEYLGRKRSLDKNYFDQVRLASLELASYEIHEKNLAGNVAELGVYKGKFARYLNQFFPNRKLYLFDTFEGFDGRDIQKEQAGHLSAGTQDFSDTSVKGVLRQMPLPDNCIPVKGFFPESAKGIEDDFVFVSLDADLFDPIYQGLLYFYPRLVHGGYIFVHDFNNLHYRGARKAVEQFCTEQKIGYVPLPDVNGTAVICK